MASNGLGSLHLTAIMSQQNPAAAGPDSSFVQLLALLSASDVSSPSAPLGQCVTHFAVHLLILTCSGSTDDDSHSAVRYLSQEEI